MPSQTVRLGLQVLVLVAVGAVVGAAANGLSRHPAALLEPVYAASESGSGLCSSVEAETAAKVGTISQAEAVVRCGACTAAFVDARGAVAYAHGHLPGALHLPPVGHHQALSVVDSLREFATVVVYDDGERCALAGGVAERLVSTGLSDVRVLEGGWSQWQADGSAAESGECQECSGPSQDGGGS